MHPTIHELTLAAERGLADETTARRRQQRHLVQEDRRARRARVLAFVGTAVVHVGERLQAVAAEAPELHQSGTPPGSHVAT